MEHKKKMVKYGGEEISEELLNKIEQDVMEKFKEDVTEKFKSQTKKICNDAIEKDKVEMAYNCLEKEYQCSVCKISPRPGAKIVKKCTFCTNIFCDSCMFHQCPSEGKINANSSVDIALTITLDIDKYMSYSCKNIKFGCKEILVNEAKLVDHEKYCDFQTIKCTEIDCKVELCYLSYLDHYENNHGTMGPGRMGDSLSIYESIGDGKVFKSPIDFTKTQRLLICANANCKPKDMANQRKCAFCLKVFCCEGKDLYDGNAKYKCSYHKCTKFEITGFTTQWVNAYIIRFSEEKWRTKKITAFNKTFFEVGILRNNLIYKWVYVLALPDEAKNYFFHAYVKNSNGENVLTYYDQVRSLVESHEEVIENENCFIIGVKQAKKFVKEDYYSIKQVDFSMKIRNIKDEAKDEDEESGIDD